MGALDGKVVMVTGASSGIGEATARALAADGAVVLLAARRRDRLEALAAAISAAGGKAEALPTDVSDAAQVEAALEGVRARHGRIDVLVNAAGLMLVAPVQEARSEEWRRMAEVNLLGLVNVTRAVLPLMKAQGGGHVVNVSSLAGRDPLPGGSVYSATKAGVVSFSAALRQECYADRIRVTVVAPGPVETDLHRQITHVASRRRLEALSRAIRFLKPEDVAEAIRYAVLAPGRVNVDEILVTPTDYVR